ncbi:MAG: DUF58 domain-containing protein [Acidimicrobiales bacterium]
MSDATVRHLSALILGVVALWMAAVSQRPEPALVAVPFLVVAAIGALTARAPAVAATVVLAEDEPTEGDVVRVTLTLVSSSGSGRARVRWVLPHGLSSTDDTDVEVVVSPAPLDVAIDVVVTTWGAIDPVIVEVESSDRWGTVTARSQARTAPLRVMPLETTLRSIVPPRALASLTGSHLSRQRGDGIEYMDARPFAPGDRVRSINWRMTARRQEVWVDERRPDRNGDVVLFIDSFVSVGSSLDSTLRRCVELAGALADHHIAANDRVGLVDLGGVLRWVRLGGGTRQLYRIVDTLIETQTRPASVHKSIDVVPPRAIPASSLVVVLSPLVDGRGIDAVRALRARGQDVVVIEVPARSFAPVPDGASRDLRLAHRAWEAEVASVRRDLRSRGVAMAQWEPGTPIDPVIAELLPFRQGVLRAAR